MQSLLQSELLDLKANPNRSAEGSVVEAKLDKGRGPVATVLVQRGTLAIGDIVVAGTAVGPAFVPSSMIRVSRSRQQSRPSQWKFSASTVPPEAGDQLAVVENEARGSRDYRIPACARIVNCPRPAPTAVLLSRCSISLRKAACRNSRLSSRAMFRVLLKPLSVRLRKLGNDEVQAQVIHSGVGAVTESDVTLAEASGAPIIAFQRPCQQTGSGCSRSIRYRKFVTITLSTISQMM